MGSGKERNSEAGLLGFLVLPLTSGRLWANHLIALCLLCIRRLIIEPPPTLPCHGDEIS